MGIIDILFPASCMLCAARGSVLCERCLSHLPSSVEVPSVHGIESVVAAFSYEGDVSRVIGGLKYQNKRATSSYFAGRIAKALPSTDFDYVTWMPSSRTGMRKRGYEPSRLIAHNVAREVRLPVRRLLRRIDDRPQTSLGRASRLHGPQLRPVRVRSPPRRVLLVDDVCTTGTSLLRAAQALHEMGVQVIHAGVVASTPSPLHVGSSRVLPQVCG